MSKVILTMLKKVNFLGNINNIQEKPYLTRSL